MNSLRLSSFFSASAWSVIVGTIFVLAAGGTIVRAQTAAQYNFSAFQSTYTDLVGGTNVPSIQSDDQFASNIPIGFSFNFCGTNYTTVAPCSNGWMRFGGTATGSWLTNALNQLTNIVPAVFPLWDDLDGQTSQTPSSFASYSTTGTAPNRVFTFEWRDWQWFYTTNSVNISFQVKLYESSNIIDFIYQPELTPPFGGSASIGIANTATDYNNLNNSSTSPTPSSTIFTTNISTSPVSGQVYRWSPGIPAPTVTNNGPVCAGGQVTLTATSPYSNATYTLVSGPGVTTPVSNTTGIFTVVANAAGSYGVTVDTGTGPSGPGFTTVNIISASTITLGPVTNPTTCGGNNGSIVISGLTPNTIADTLYYSKNGVPFGPFIISANASGLYTLGGLTAGVYTQIRVRGANGCTSNQLVAALGDPGAPAAPTLSYNPPLCVGSTLQLAATPAITGTYQFSGPNSFSPLAAGSASATRPNMSFADTGVYYVTVRNAANCTSLPGSVRVVVNPTPPVPTTTPISFCQGSVATPLTAGGQNLKWYTTLTGGTALGSAPVPNTSTPGTQLFYVSQTVATCEGPRDTVVVTIVPKAPLPTADTVVERCQFSSPLPLTATGNALRWYATPTGGTGSATAPSPSTTATGVFFFYVTQTVAGCESDRLQIRVIVKPKPGPPTVLSPVRLCQGDPATPLTAQGTGLLWYTTPGGVGGVPTAPTPLTAYEDTLTYFVSQTVNGCESDRALISVHVNFRPNNSIIAEREYICLDDSIIFRYFGNGRPTSQYFWTATGPIDTTYGNGTQNFTIKYDAPGFYTVSLVVDNGGCLSPTATRTFEVRQIPRFAINMPEEACQGVPVVVSATDATQGIDSFRWDFGGGAAVAGSAAGGPYSVVWDGPGQKVVSTTVYTRQCGARPVTDTIVIEETPDARIQPVSNATVCNGDTITLRADYNPRYTYVWRPQQFVAGSRFNEVDARVSKTGFMTLEVITTRLGCRDKDSVLLTARDCCDAMLPTAFSPNGDGLNDRFRIITPGINDLAVLRVTNRWGRTVWETADNMSGGWDGTIGGSPADMGTYFWYMRYTCSDGKIYEKSGEVTLVR